MIYSLTPDTLPQFLESDVPVVIDFYADWCGPCKMLAPIIERLAQEHGDKVKIGKVDADTQPGICSHFQVMSLPTLLLFKDKKVVDVLKGFKPAPEIEEFILS